MNFINFVNFNSFINMEFPSFNWDSFPVASLWNQNYNQPLFQFQQTEFSWNCNMDTFTLSSPKKTSLSQKSERIAPLPNPTRLSSTKNLQWWIAKGYNPTKGKKLCAATKQHLDANPIMSNGKRKVRGQCVGYVRKGINDAFYGGSEHYSNFGKAYLCGEKYLSQDKNFKKLTGVNLAQINPADIPEGAVVIYNPGYTNSKLGKICGHGEVSNGNGQGYSDCLTRLKNSGRQSIREIWLPV